MAYEEIPMLEMRQNLLKQEEYSNKSSHQNNKNTPNFMPSLPPMTSDEEQRLSQGISVTKTSVVDGELRTQREIVKANVFGMGIAPPTMTLEEFAELELADAMAREEREKNAVGGPRK